MSDSLTYVQSVTTILALLDKKGAVIEYIKRRGREIHGYNIQNAKGKAKSYQVKQVIKAIEMLEVNYGIEE